MALQKLKDLFNRKQPAPEAAVTNFAKSGLPAEWCDSEAAWQSPFLVKRDSSQGLPPVAETETAAKTWNTLVPGPQVATGFDLREAELKTLKMPNFVSSQNGLQPTVTRILPAEYEGKVVNDQTFDPAIRTHNYNLLQRLRAAGVRTIAEFGTPVPAKATTQDGYYREVEALIQKHMDPGFKLNAGFMQKVTELCAEQSQPGPRSAQPMDLFEPYSLVNKIAKTYSVTMYAEYTPSMLSGFGGLQTGGSSVRLENLTLGDQNRMLRTLYTAPTPDVTPKQELPDNAWLEKLDALSQKYLNVTVRELLQPADKMAQAVVAGVEPYAYLNQIIGENDLVAVRELNTVPTSLGPRADIENTGLRRTQVLTPEMQERAWAEYRAAKEPQVEYLEEAKNSAIADYLIKKEAEDLSADSNPTLG